MQVFAHPPSQTIILILLFFTYVVINLWSLIPNICWNILKLLAICYFWTPTIFVVYCFISITVCSLVGPFTMIKFLSRDNIKLLLYHYNIIFVISHFFFCFEIYIYRYDIQVIILCHFNKWQFTHLLCFCCLTLGSGKIIFKHSEKSIFTLHCAHR